MELGINVLWWEEEKVYSRAENAVKTMALSNPEKKIFVISPFYCYDDFKGGKDAEKWRTALKKITDSLRRRDFPPTKCIQTYTACRA